MAIVALRLRQGLARRHHRRARLRAHLAPPAGARRVRPGRRLDARRLPRRCAGGPRGIGELAVARVARRQPGDGASGPSWSTSTRPSGSGCCCPAWSTPRRPAASPRCGNGSPTSSPSLERGQPAFDVLVDCGRLQVADPPWPVLRAAAIVLVVTGAHLSDLSSARVDDQGDRAGLHRPPGAARLAAAAAWSATATAGVRDQQGTGAAGDRAPAARSAYRRGAQPRRHRTGEAAADARGRRPRGADPDPARPPPGPALLADARPGGRPMRFEPVSHDPRGRENGATSTVPPLPRNGRHHHPDPPDRPATRPTAALRQRRPPHPRRTAPATATPRTAHGSTSRWSASCAVSSANGSPSGSAAGSTPPGEEDLERARLARRGGRRVRRRRPPGRHPDARQPRSGSCSTRSPPSWSGSVGSSPCWSTSRSKRCTSSAATRSGSPGTAAASTGSTRSPTATTRLVEILQAAARRAGSTERSLSTSKPTLDLQLPDGSRLAAVLPGQPPAVRGDPASTTRST